VAELLVWVSQFADQLPEGGPRRLRPGVHLLEEVEAVMSRRVAINLIAFLGVFVLMLWWAVNNIISFDFIERPYEITGEFAATAGVSGNSEVAYLGVNYGSVSQGRVRRRRVVITMSIDRDKEIPAGSVARIFRKSAIGEPYIDFAPPEDFEEGGPSIEPATWSPRAHHGAPGVLRAAAVGVARARIRRSRADPHPDPRARRRPERPG
jgi:ABC-type transporter Mla subunit MlaD